MTKITLATTQSDFKTIVELADIIWREHYIPIIGIEQVNYMLDKFQSLEAVKQQIKDGYEYYNITFEDEPAGYISIKNEGNTLFLSKIYVLSSLRGKKIGKTALQFIEDKAKTYNLNTITLTVNKHNVNSIAAYNKLGFTTIEEIVIDIGNGFVMDDYKMMMRI